MGPLQPDASAANVPPSVRPRPHTRGQVSSKSNLGPPNVKSATRLPPRPPTVRVFVRPSFCLLPPSSKPEAVKPANLG